VALASIANTAVSLDIICNNNNLSSPCGKPLKLNPTPSWGGTEVGDYQGLPSNAKNDKQIASCGVPVCRFADDDFNITLAIPTSIFHLSNKGNTTASSCDAGSVNEERHLLQSSFNGVSNQCLDSAANVLPDSPPVSTVAALASIANTVVHNNNDSAVSSSDQSTHAKRRRMQFSISVVPDRGSSGNFVEQLGLQSNTLNDSEVDTVSPPPRDDVPPFETGSNLASVESITYNGHSAHNNGPLSNSIFISANTVFLPPGRPPEPA
jgi:hypothetical protein